MRKQQISPLNSAQQGVVLIEAMIAILIFTFGVLGIIGLQAAMVKNTSESKYRADASNIAQQAIGQMWSNPNQLPTKANPCLAYPNLGVVTPVVSLPNGSITVVQPSAPPNPGPCTSEYLFVVTWQAPGEQAHNFTTLARIDGV